MIKVNTASKGLSGKLTCKITNKYSSIMFFYQCLFITDLSLLITKSVLIFRTETTQYLQLVMDCICCEDDQYTPFHGITDADRAHMLFYFHYLGVTPPKVLFCDSFLIEGYTGFQSYCNGIYDCTTEMRDGMPLYSQRSLHDNSHHMFYHARLSRWCIQSKTIQDIEKKGLMVDRFFDRSFYPIRGPPMMPSDISSQLHYLDYVDGVDSNRYPASFPIIKTQETGRIRSLVNCASQ